MKPFEQLARRLRADLAAGTLPAEGDALASQATLAAHYHVAVPTLRNALGELEKAGLVFSRIGQGWFLAGGPQGVLVRRCSVARTTLREEILGGTLAVGARVTAPQVAARFDIPLKRAKQVLGALAASGLMQARSGSGSFVKAQAR